MIMISLSVLQNHGQMASMEPNDDAKEDDNHKIQAIESCILEINRILCRLEKRIEAVAEEVDEIACEANAKLLHRHANTTSNLADTSSRRFEDLFRSMSVSTRMNNVIDGHVSSMNEEYVSPESKLVLERDGDGEGQSIALEQIKDLYDETRAWLVITSTTKSAAAV